MKLAITCVDKDKFVELDKSIKGNVTFANHSKVSIKERYDPNSNER